jgi:DNA-binding MarR family transcriptional regulator
MPHRKTLGVLLRHLIELLDGDVETAYREAGLVYRPRFTPVVHLLTDNGPSSIRAISKFGGITHSAASQTVSEMAKRGLVRAEPGQDGRERIITLTEAGKALLPQLRVHWAATNAAAAELSEEIGIPLPDVLEKAIGALEKRSFLQRIHNHRQPQQAEAPAHGSGARVAAH